jgi:hypothetical protein
MQARGRREPQAAAAAGTGQSVSSSTTVRSSTLARPLSALSRERGQSRSTLCRVYIERVAGEKREAHEIEEEVHYFFVF